MRAAIEQAILGRIRPALPAAYRDLWGRERLAVIVASLSPHGGGARYDGRVEAVAVCDTPDAFDLEALMAALDAPILVARAAGAPLRLVFSNLDERALDAAIAVRITFHMTIPH